jgi:hypothetical protein
MIKRTVKALEALLELNRASEALLIDIVASYAPWLAPVPVAMMTYQHMVTLLGFPAWAALAGALVVEFLGLSAVSTCVQFWTWNTSKLKTQARAPLTLAVFSGVFYLAVVIVINAMLDDAPTTHRIAKALLSSLSAVAAVILAMRSSHTKRITEAKHERQERKAERQARRIERAPQVVQVPLAAGPNNGHGGRSREVLTQ